MSGTRAVVRESDMSWDMQQDCVDCAAHALHVLRLREQTAIAQYMKKELDEKYGARWHCIVGHAFAAYVGHDAACFVHFSIDNVYFVVWRVNTEYATTSLSCDTLAAAQDVKRALAPSY